MERQHIAYLLLAGLMMAAGVVICYLRHNSRRAQERRRRVRDLQAYEEMMEARQGDPE